MAINSVAQGGMTPRRRIRELKTTVESPSGPLTLWRREVTIFAPDGSMETTSEVHAEIRNGVKFASPDDVKGQCEQEHCGALVGVDTIRFCMSCGMTLCRKHARFVDDEIGDLCFSCLKTFKRKMFWRSFWTVVTSPFVD